MPGPSRTLLVLAVCLAGCKSSAGSVEQYSLPQLSGSCTAKLYTEDPLLEADELPLNTTVEEARTVSLHFALVSTDWRPVRAPWIVSLINPGYFGAADYPNFELATAVDYG